MSTIETERLLLRPFRESDAADVLEYLSGPLPHCFAGLKLDELGASVIATKTVLSGSPDDVNVRPSEPETVTLGKTTELTLKPFSLTVLSFPLK